MTQAPRLSIGQCATLACLLEVTAPKPGNVHRGADFQDLQFTDLVVSAAAIGPVMNRAERAGVGRTVLDSIRATRALVDTNTNLGIVLLLAPLAAVPRDRSLLSGVPDVLRSITAEDTRQVYEAIRVARPGGLGRVDQMDVHQRPPSDLLAAMRSAAARDLIAREYAENFSLTLQVALPWLLEARRAGRSLTLAIIDVQLRLLSRHPDSLIVRKCGLETGRQASLRAARVIDAGPPGEAAYEQALRDLDFWLRSDPRRNPGTTADLLAAALFAGLREDLLHPPYR